MTECALRIEAHHVEGADPSLCYVAVYITDPHGQWGLVRDWSFGPFGDGVDTREVIGRITGCVVAMLT